MFSSDVSKLRFAWKLLQVKFCHDDDSCTKSSSCPGLQVRCPVKSRRPVPLHMLTCAIALRSVKLSRCIFFFLISSGPPVLRKSRDSFLMGAKNLVERHR